MAKMALKDCVKTFLELALVHPDKEPKRVRDQRDNEMMIIGYNKAQEDLRWIIRHEGYARYAALSTTRSDKQRQPIDIGGIKAWVSG